jgi:hypothetical protein
MAKRPCVLASQPAPAGDLIFLLYTNRMLTASMLKKNRVKELNKTTNAFNFYLLPKKRALELKSKAFKLL